MFENQLESSTAASTKPETPAWEREVIEKLALSALTEQRRTRRWGVFFKSLMFAYLAVVLWLTVYPRFNDDIGVSSEGHTAVINIVGPIMEGEETNATNIIKSLRNAVENKATKGVVMHLNTPGGSPVQAAYVYQEIGRLREQHPDIPIYAVISDICASGGYYIAAAADKIFVNPASIVGSIGVIMNGFGFVDTMNKLGVERRLLIAGSHKAILDPFSPVKKEETQHMQKMLDQVHQQFIDAVRNGRGEKLQESPEMFSGLVWSGTESIKLGLTDGFGNDDSVARDVIGAEELINFTHQERLIDRLAGKLGASFGHALGAFFHSWSLR